MDDYEDDFEDGDNSKRNKEDSSGGFEEKGDDDFLF